MSGVNPAAAAAAAASAVEAALALELQQLAANSAALKTMLMQGDVVQATVQPFNGLTDVLEIFGLRVPASLPPNLYPGDTLTVAVQGFAGDQVQVQVLSSQAQAAAPATPAATPATGAQPAAAAASEGDTLELTQTPVPVVADKPASAAAASTDGEPAAAAAESGDSIVQPATATPAQLFGTQVRLPPTEPETLDVEVRLALARTAATRVPPPAARGGSPAAQAAVVRSGNAPPAASTSRPLSFVPPPPTSSIPRVPIVPIAPRAPSAQSAAAPLPGAPAQVRATTMVPASQVRVAAADVDELLQDPVALLRALRIPVTPTALTFAKLVTTQPEQVATALRALETALPDADDGRIATLKTLAAFVGTLDPEEPTFETQVASYIAHVVEGPEPKLLSVVQGQVPAGSAPPGASTAQAPAPQTAAAAQVIDEGAIAARSIERLAAADADLKTQLLALLSAAQPESALGESGTVIARNALTALVASQLGALAAQQSQPPTWTFTVPITIDQQLYPAQVKVSRDKPDGENENLTGDDFHIAFILDTKRFGTVGIDVHSVQRSVSIAVRTERPSAATTFKSALAQLGDRLQLMKYNVKSLEAGTTRTKGPELSNAPPPSDSLHAMDSSA